MGQTLTFIEGNTYDGTLGDKPTFTVTEDFTTGFTAELQIWRPAKGTGSKTVLLTTAATIDSATEISVSMDADFLSEIIYGSSKAYPYETVRYDLIVTRTADSKTAAIESGECIIYERGDS